MSVLMKQMIVLKHVQTKLEATFVDVIVALIWMMMGLLVMVCIQACPYMTGSVILISVAPIMYWCIDYRHNFAIIGIGFHCSDTTDILVALTAHAIY